MISIFADAEHIKSITIWAVVILVLTVLFGLAIYYIKRSFTHRCIYVNVTVGGKVVKTQKQHYKIGEEVIVNTLVLPKTYQGYRAFKIESDADIAEGSLVSFKMPNKDVNIYFRKVEQEDKTIKKDRQIKMRNVPIPRYIKKKADREVIPVILMNLNEVKKYIRKSNSNKYFPVINSYKCAKSEGKDVLILYNGDLIYAILIYSDITFKVFFRSDANYVNESMDIVDSLVKIKNDIYSFVLDYSFETKEQFFTILNHAYEYILYISYVKEGEEYLADKDTVEKFNRDMLSLNIEISREFDPVFDKAIAEAKKFKKLQQRIAEKKRELDKPLITAKQKVLKEIEENNEYIDPHNVDDFIAPINITEDKYIETTKEPEKERIHDLPGIFESLGDIPVAHPAKIAFNKIVDYIMMRKDMVSLTIDVPRDIKRDMAEMKFISSTFALICLKNNQYIIFMKLDEDYANKTLIKKHKNVEHVRNGEEYDWYKVTLDKSFKSYEEIYDVLLNSYEYTKKCYYRRYS